MADYSKALSALTADVLSGKLDPAAALGPEIWVENKDFTIRTTLWSAEDKSPLRVNLNACSRWELMTFPGITAGKARKILAARDKAGFFASVDAARRAGFTGAAK